MLKSRGMGIINPSKVPKLKYTVWVGSKKIFVRSFSYSGGIEFYSVGNRWRLCATDVVFYRSL